MVSLVKSFIAKGGVRQGDPISPLLFVLVANLLQSIVDKAKDFGLLKCPIPLQYSSTVEPWDSMTSTT